MPQGLSPLIIDHLGWECVFYIAGGALILFIIPWWILFVSDDPRGHNSVTCLNTHTLEIADIEGDKFSVLDAEPIHTLNQSESLPQKPSVPWRVLILNPSVLAMAWQYFAGTILGDELITPRADKRLQRVGVGTSFSAGCQHTCRRSSILAAGAQAWLPFFLTYCVLW